ncbi:MAG: outer membrane beta-barrel protein [Acidobacteriota bacterium]|nr:outer membrane beta-barrel protein [Acidobacteriota bacterium]
MRLFKFVPAAAVGLLGLFLVGAPSARAQYHFGYSQPRDVDITGFFGGRFFGKINLPNSTGPFDYLKTDNNYDYGVMGDVDLVGPLQAEFMWSRQPTTLEGHDPVSGLFSPVGNVNVDNYQLGVIYQMHDSAAKLRPYFGGGIGVTHWGSNGALPFTNKLGFNIGGGVKYYFERHVGMRLDFRWLPTRTTSQVGTFFDPFFGFYQANINNYAEQVQITGGLIFRF